MQRIPEQHLLMAPDLPIWTEFGVITKEPFEMYTLYGSRSKIYPNRSWKIVLLTNNLKRCNYDGDDIGN